MPTRQLPNFIGIGTQRGGTTWLYNCLKEHPEVFMPKEKELSFFCSSYNKGMDYYSSFFDDYNGEKAIGEISPSYMKRKQCAELIVKNIADVKILIVLRNPIDRAFSAYQRFSKEKNEWNFKEAIGKKEGLLRNGKYYEQLVNYFTLFKKEQILVLLFEELKNDNLGTIKKVYKFLDVDNDFVPSWIGKITNTVVFPRLTNVLNYFHLNWFIELIKTTPLDPLIRKWVAKNKKHSKSEVPPELRRKLIAHFREPNKLLEKLLEKNLEKWNQ